MSTSSKGTSYQQYMIGIMICCQCFSYPVGTKYLTQVEPATCCHIVNIVQRLQKYIAKPRIVQQINLLNIMLHPMDVCVPDTSINASPLLYYLTKLLKWKFRNSHNHVLGKCLTGKTFCLAWVYHACKQEQYPLLAVPDQVQMPKYWPLK